MDVEGVYRKSGGSGQVNAVKAGFEASDDYDISDPELEIHAVTSCLKQYFRRLPIPLITFDVYDLLLDASRVENEADRAVRMREALGHLPRHHRNVLEFLVFHLARVTAHEKDNLVSCLHSELCWMWWIGLLCEEAVLEPNVLIGLLFFANGWIRCR